MSENEQVTLGGPQVSGPRTGGPRTARVASAAQDDGGLRAAQADGPRSDGQWSARASGLLAASTQLAPRLSRRRFVALAAGAAMLAATGLAGCSGGSGEEAATDAGSASTGSASSTADMSEQSISCFYFDTYIDISAICPEGFLATLDERMDYFENRFSRTVEGSDIWNINEAGGQPVEVCAETIDIIQQALAYSEESDGLFDISIGSVSTLWDFIEGVKPDDADIQEGIKHIDYTQISVDEDAGTVTLLDPDMKLDLGGIAKGYICDDLVAMLAEAGVQDACLSLGGNVYVMGMSYDGDEWNVGVQDPNGTYSDAIASLVAGDLSVVTSGLYERYFEQDGVMYYHILDPKTGYPVETDLKSVSITCDSSTAADTYATILFLKGHDAAKELVESDERFYDGVFIDKDDNISTIDGSEFQILVDEG